MYVRVVAVEEEETMVVAEWVAPPTVDRSDVSNPTGEAVVEGAPSSLSVCVCVCVHLCGRRFSLETLCLAVFSLKKKREDLPSPL